MASPPMRHSSEAGRTLDEGTQRAWMAQWRTAAVQLAEQRRRELRSFSPEEALAASDVVLSLAGTTRIDDARLQNSGLVQQQALFHRRRR